MEYRFEYQKYWAKVAFGAVPIAVWIVCQGPLTSTFNDNGTFYAFSGIVTVVIARLIMGLFDRLSLFRRTGVFRKEDGCYILKTGKEYSIENVRRISAWKSNLFGMHLWFLQIEAGEEIKIASVPVGSDTPFTETDLYKIFSVILSDNPSFVQEKNSSGEEIPYYYSIG